MTKKRQPARTIPPPFTVGNSVPISIRGYEPDGVGLVRLTERSGVLDTRAKTTPATHTTSRIGEAMCPAGSRGIQLESPLREARGLHPISPVSVRETQRRLQLLYLALRFFDSNSHGERIDLTLLDRLGLPVGCDEDVEAVQGARKKVSISGTGWVRCGYHLGARCSPPRRAGHRTPGSPRRCARAEGLRASRIAPLGFPPAPLPC